MINVHHLANSRSQRVLWLLEELGLSYEVTRYERDPKTKLAPDALLAVHPLGKSPVITDGDVTVAETGAIVEYLTRVRGDGGLARAPGDAGWLDYSFWLHFAEGSAMPPRVASLLFDEVGRRAPFFVRPIARAISGQVHRAYLTPTMERQSRVMEAALAGTGWFAGDFSAADIMMSFPIETTAARHGLDGLPRLAAFLERIHARPAYQAALERGGEYAYA